jgi:hypothetical protein
LNLPLAGADGVDGAPAKHAYGLAWSWPSWGSSKPTAVNGTDATTETNAAVERTTNNSPKVFVSIASNVPASGGR